MISIEQLKSYQDTPEPLKKLCLRQIINRPVNLCRYILPQELGDLITTAFRQHAIANRFNWVQCLNFFSNFSHKFIPLKRINFSGLPIHESLFINFIREYQDQLEEVNIANCEELTLNDTKAVNEVLKKTNSHKSLIIGDTFYSNYDLAHPPNGKLLESDIKLKKLVIHKAMPPQASVEGFSINLHLAGFLSPSLRDSLKYLDLSESLIGTGSAFMQLESLEILILYDCNMSSYLEVVFAISHLRNLRVLDLSKRVQDQEDIYMPNEPKALDLLVSRSTQLEHLDISGTNLIGGKDRHISAFEARLDKPFKFLGLFHTGNDAAYRSCIPAITIAGEANETQILNACEAYMDRPEQLQKALNDLYNLYKNITPSETFDNINRALDVVLPILTRHISDEQVIIFTTATLWCIVKINVTIENLQDAKVRRNMTSKLLDVMMYHSTSRVILINGGLTLLLLPDIICEHSRVAAISLKMCQDTDARTQGFGTTLLNTLACQVGGDQKIFIGQLNAIEIMLDIIKTKVQENTCDEILETAWSTLWNITDETQINCLKFLEFGGLEIFEQCMDKFAENKEVLRNIMGLLGNVAECKDLRFSFMKERYLKRFHTLLSSDIDGIECSYNACGILAHLVSDGKEFWSNRLDPRFDGQSYFYNSTIFNSKERDYEESRQQVMKDMRRAIERWPLNSKRNINYRSFEPIVRLLENHVPPEAQYWAVFALANLTRINPSKYCPMLVPHNGLEKLQGLARFGEAEYVQNLARITLYQYERFESEGTLSGLEQCNSVDLNVVKNFRAEQNQSDVTSEMGEIIL